MTADANPHWWLRRAIAYVGRVDDSKGVRSILEACRRLADVSRCCPPLWIVGGLPAEIDRLRREAAATVTSLEERHLLEWWAYQRSDGISTILTRSLVLVSHSQYEPGGRVVIEAMAAGVPVIATPHGFARELVEDWVTGFRVPYGDVDLLYRRLEHFARQPLLRNALGMRARRAVHEALNAWRFVDTHCDTYEAVIAGRPREAIDHARDLPDDIFDSRDFEPTYPLGRRPLSPEDVRPAITLLMRGPVGRLEPFTPGGSSSFWSFETEDATAWIAKECRPRLETRVMWDRNVTKIVRTAEERYATELYAATLPGFAPWHIASPDRLLLIRRRGRSPDSPGGETIRQLASLIRRLAAAPLQNREPVEALVNQPRLSACSSAAPDMVRELAAIVANDAPWDMTAPVGLRLSWALLLGDDPARPDIWSAADESFLQRALLLIPPYERVVVCHGSPHSGHVITINGEAYLIDGDQIHPGTEGQDLAYAWLAAIRQIRSAPVPTCEALLADFIGTRGDLRTVIAWAAFLAYEGLYRHSVLVRPFQFDEYRRLWQIVCGISRDITP